MTEQQRPPTAIDAAQYSAAVAAYSRQTSAVDEFRLRASLNLVRSANILVNASEREVFRPRGLSWTGFGVLFTISVFGDLEARTIARLLGVTKQAASLVLTTLERDGYVVRSRGIAQDRRLVTVSLTERGHEATRSGMADQAALVARQLGDLTDVDVRELNALLERILQRADDGGSSREPAGHRSSADPPPPTG